MYEAFDSFLAGDTWYTPGDTDQAQFFRAFATVVDDPEFNADKMAAYMRTKIGVGYGDTDHPFWGTIDKLAAKAQAVHHYLRANGLS